MTVSLINTWLDVQPPSEGAGIDASLVFAIAAFGLATLMIVYVRRRRRQGTER